MGIGVVWDRSGVGSAVVVVVKRTLPRTLSNQVREDCLYMILISLVILIYVHYETICILYGNNTT